MQDVAILLAASYDPDEGHEEDDEANAPSSRRLKSTDVLSTLADNAPRLRTLCLAFSKEGRHPILRIRRLPSQVLSSYIFSIWCPTLR